jgi:predicted secreted hydrolase
MGWECAESMTMYRGVNISLFVFFLVLLGGGPNPGAQDTSYHSITGPCNLGFPGDHGPHPGYRTEWWYYTGNLHSQSGNDYGFQLTFFRRQISPPGAEQTWPQPASAWRTQQLFLAHAALTDITKNRFHHAEVMSREMPGLAGAHQEAGTTSISVRNWALALSENEHLLETMSDSFALSLRLRPSKAPVLHGEAGYSRKGVAPESASCYYSFSRLLAEGSVSLNGMTIPVHGTAWMDHEFSSDPLEPDIEGWDWFSLQLSNDTELMLYLLRKKDGSYSAASGGTLVDASGKASAIGRDDIVLEILDRWKSPHTRVVYPSGWRLKIPPLHLELAINPGIRDQEMQTPETTNITYWEGSVSVNGSSAGKNISGEGYVELTGYAGAMGGRM